MPQPPPHEEEEDASLREARARLASLMHESMPAGPFQTRPQPQRDGASSSAAAASPPPPPPPSAGFGLVMSGFDETLPPLFALLVARYDAWLLSDPARRRGDDEAGMLETLDVEQAQFAAELDAARLRAEGGVVPLATVEEADCEDDSPTDGGSSMGCRSKLSDGSRAPRPAQLTTTAGARPASTPQLRQHQHQHHAHSPSSAGDSPLCSPGGAEGAAGNGGGGGYPGLAAADDDGGGGVDDGEPGGGADGDGSGDDEYDAYLFRSLTPLVGAGAEPAGAAGGPPGARDSRNSRRRSRAAAAAAAPAAGSRPVDYSFLADAAQVAHRFVFSGYCSYGFHALWRDLDAVTEKRPATRQLLQALRKLPLPLLQQPAAAAPAGGDLDAASPSSLAAAHAALGGRSRRLRTFILTNASWQHLAPAMRHALGADWLDLFDIVLTEARKRSMFQGPPAAAGPPADRVTPPGAGVAPGGGAGSGSGGSGGSGLALDAASGFLDDDGPAGGGADARPALSGRGSPAPQLPAACHPLRPLDARTGKVIERDASGRRIALRPSAASSGGGLVADPAVSKVWAGGSLQDLLATLREHAYIAAAAPHEHAAAAAASSQPAPPRCCRARVLRRRPRAARHRGARGRGGLGHRGCAAGAGCALGGVRRVGVGACDGGGERRRRSRRVWGARAGTARGLQRGDQRWRAAGAQPRRRAQRWRQLTPPPPPPPRGRRCRRGRRVPAAHAGQRRTLVRAVAAGCTAGAPRDAGGA